ncbi:MAG: 30S ribosomal protein S2 [Pseudomonadales bacterium]|jgi:small subunit ribosomal protein S2|nr:30S ribosomal protein S2 [Pseudomonadales bacterium]
MKDISLEALFEAGVHLGHQSTSWHPKMAQWIYAEKDGIHIFDLAKTAEQLEKARTYVRDLAQNGKSLVVVGCKKQAAEIVEEGASETGAMYIVNRWPGGLITNWEQVSKSIKRMNEISRGLVDGKYKEYTKYERVQLEKELARLERLFRGVKDLKSEPDCLFIVDINREKNAVKEALGANIPIIALTDSNVNPTGVEIPVPGNDDALSSIKIIVDYILDGYAEGKKAAKPEEKKA